MSEPLSFQIILAFLGGFIVLILPCILPTLLGYFAFATGVTTQNLEEGSEEKTSRIFLSLLSFSFGLSLVFALGTIPSPIRSFLVNYYPFLAKASGLIILFFGLIFIKVLKIALPYQEQRLRSEEVFFGLTGIFVLGAAFGAAWTHCLDPILSILLSLTNFPDTVLRGSFLLSIYSLGMGTSLVLAGFLLSWFLRTLRWIKHRSQGISIVSGVFLIAIGIALVNTSWWVRLSKVFIGLTSNSLAHQLEAVLLEFFQK